MPQHIEDAFQHILHAAVAIQALAQVMALQSDHPDEAAAARALAVAIEDAARRVAE